MLPGLNLPASLAGLLVMFRPVFTGPSFRTFCGLAAGLAGQVRRRTVCGMLAGAGRGGAGRGRMTGRITSPGPPGILMSWAWRSPRWWYRCWSRRARRSSWQRTTRCSAGPAVRCTGRRGSRTGPPRPGASCPSGPASSRPGSSFTCRSAPVRCACRCWPGCTCRAGARPASPPPGRPGQRGLPRG